MQKSRLVLAGATAILTVLFCGSVAQAQTHLTGFWRTWYDQHYKIRGAGPDPDTILGVPVDAAGRARGLA
jgi:hypothetical protein